MEAGGAFERAKDPALAILRTGHPPWTESKTLPPETGDRAPVTPSAVKRSRPTYAAVVSSAYAAPSRKIFGKDRPPARDHEKPVSGNPCRFNWSITSGESPSFGIIFC
jgi:hypothetical protein